MRPIACLLALALTAGLSLRAQPCYSENNTSTFANNVSMGGPNLLLAIKFTPSATVAVRAIQVFTGEATGANSVALWSHDATANAPARRLSLGTWSMRSANSWQGANLAAPVPLVARTTYWMVWGAQNRSQASVELPKNTRGQQYRGSFNGGTTWSGPFQSNSRHWKFRLWCRKLGSTATSGTGCPGSNNSVPLLNFGGTPEINNMFSINVSGATPNRPALLTFGISKTTWGAIRLPFDLAPLGAPGCKLLCSLESFLTSGTNGSGSGSISFQIPNDRNLVCLGFCNQWLIVDPGANTLGIALSNCGEVTIGG